jgi:hypothetical protein
MDLEHFAESEVAIAVAATAVALSPPVRRVLRRGAVYGVAGALVASDAVSSFARGTARGVRTAAESAGGAMRGASEEGEAAPSGGEPAPAGGEA